MNPGHGDFSKHCIVVSDITVTEGDNSIRVRFPTGKLDIEVRLRDVPSPRKTPLSQAFWFRIEKVDKDGRRDPDHRQWLSTTLNDGIYTGRLEHLAPGAYHIAAFHNDEARKSADLGFGILHVTEKALEIGRATVTIDRTVEQADADQPAGKPADEPPVKDQPSLPTPKDAPR